MRVIATDKILARILSLLKGAGFSSQQVLIEHTGIDKNRLTKIFARILLLLKGANLSIADSSLAECGLAECGLAYSRFLFLVSPYSCIAEVHRSNNLETSALSQCYN